MFNPIQMIQAFNQFRANFQGDPQKAVEYLVASRRISQGQLNQLQSMAKQFMAILNNTK